MKAQFLNAMSLIDNCAFAAERLKASTLKTFVPPRSTVDASVSHWFARGWHRTARDFTDFVNPGVCEFDR
jgi:hypothetical protein